MLNLTFLRIGQQWSVRQVASSLKSILRERISKFSQFTQVCNYPLIWDIALLMFTHKGGVSTDITADALHPDMDLIKPGVSRVSFM